MCGFHSLIVPIFTQHGNRWKSIRKDLYRTFTEQKCEVRWAHILVFIWSRMHTAFKRNGATWGLYHKLSHNLQQTKGGSSSVWLAHSNFLFVIMKPKTNPVRELSCSYSSMVHYMRAGCLSTRCISVQCWEAAVSL